MSTLPKSNFVFVVAEWSGGIQKDPGANVSVWCCWPTVVKSDYIRDGGSVLSFYFPSSSYPREREVGAGAEWIKRITSAQWRKGRFSWRRLKSDETNVFQLLTDRWKEEEGVPVSNQTEEFPLSSNIGVDSGVYKKRLRQHKAFFFLFFFFPNDMENVLMRHSAVAKRRRRRIKNCKWAPESIIRAGAQDRFSSFFSASFAKPELSWSLFFFSFPNARACVCVCLPLWQIPGIKGNCVWLFLIHSPVRAVCNLFRRSCVVRLLFPPARIMMSANVCTHTIVRNIYCTGAPRPARVDEPSDCSLI